MTLGRSAAFTMPGQNKNNAHVANSKVFSIRWIIFGQSLRSFFGHVEFGKPVLNWIFMYIETETLLLRGHPIPDCINIFKIIDLNSFSIPVFSFRCRQVTFSICWSVFFKCSPPRQLDACFLGLGDDPVCVRKFFGTFFPHIQQFLEIIGQTTKLAFSLVFAIWIRTSHILTDSPEWRTIHPFCQS